jgi:uncharacterized protein (DUF1330 family)
VPRIARAWIIVPGVLSGPFKAKGENMAAYMIVDIDVQDPKAFETYRKMVVPTIEKYGGKYLVRGGATSVLEGNWQPKRVVVLQFDSVERAREWYDSPEYRPARDIRLKASTGNAVLVEGV